MLVFEQHCLIYICSVRLSQWAYWQLEGQNIDFTNLRKGRDRIMFLADYFKL